jgi:hypothetical protein
MMHGISQYLNKNQLLFKHIIQLKYIKQKNHEYSD